ncbi:dTDP-4-dehydrorhamnose 3,5-epimerase family protein [Polynucleobacter sp. 80A-SIGWE]|uniref:dTDP-4-dehydrorhamnose 3,5-epimerase family protein n=1 Tax=Polynucleobacter sp. 80A-SIGWE TaxID=2689100 RepID=UPI001C0E8D18|nr:dTDP-4-dehydrorhamnose 3,5-epimerase family protein [Polynucleobacter sp. 80A-SIGWE]MBU3589075.1 dTDP-4-dehydrorhamnose 3,5-epimerase family protein [Polynucleobacter sp. 80A-SIGWE]
MMLTDSRPKLIDAEIFEDDRGFMSVYFEGSSFIAKIIKMTSSKYGVLRGFHYQLPPTAQDKIILVLEGAIQDVCMEMAGNQPTGMVVDNSIGDGAKCRALFVPNNWAHSYLTLSESSKVLYLCNEGYGNEISLNPIENYKGWKLGEADMLISRKDLNNG